MKLSDFDYELPEQLIAHYPLAERSSSRLLCLDRSSGSVEHHRFHDIVKMITSRDLLVFNDTQVLPARLLGQRKDTGGAVEVLIERLLPGNEAIAHVRASNARQSGLRLVLSSAQGDHTLEAEILGRKGRFFRLRFFCEEPLVDALDKVGHMPLPTYIKRDDESLDQSRYQTVYARHPGAVAAPTAGLHFDDALLDALRAKSVEMAFVTLHVGSGTFQPVRVDDVQDHKMHSEWISVPAEVCARVNACHERGGRVIAVGTTSVRSLESAAMKGFEGNAGTELQPYEGETDIFIYPGYQFRVVDAMVTNFHLPRSTLMMLISAFAGREQVMAAYQQAIEQEYRFFSYGDAMFIR
ncbi:tRNA preQ1(34) S-adenosylmethionine ribosyltransferase-isomerase QueA [Pseudohongiella sp.]|uniref:S-adenosylmethionine:tRNA ribosyltransferase-isomerase n=1 Tax=marine sediment metagenome TaxID=412755 RepID=A0A0F9WK23_9ZZZZ|nr:tRNA preQ1(34) S-adenosylmethionine ribosyltransferase-isomerase QueA [Pseudohongiella sp.]HDZ09539.1 tRNA preQ1(34) S-adenosylmethionine ribosyltransferase-isomerase QueA [Pseudohongiella sp.]HEA62639.1 tRNA preQ1(34) S-adenosylmethionine ribosyltransferase-isomerase QueA [Pseudohongiella sp.]